MQRLKNLLISLLLVLSTLLYGDGPQVGNYIGDGNIHLTLSTNSPGWNPYSVGYKGQANIPYDAQNPKNNQWSAYNIYDSDNNYYGTLTLGSNAYSTWWKGYVAPQEKDPISPYSIDSIQGAVSGGGYFISITGTPKTVPSTGPFPDAPPASPALYPGTFQPIVLSVKNDQIVNDKGTPIRLKGLVRSSLEWNPQGQYLSPSDIALIASWGGNIVRFDLNQQYWFDSNPKEMKGSYKQIIDAVIHECIAHNMAVILDLHWLVDSQTSMANKDSIRFWTEVATAYKDFGTVLFELFNEPFNIDPNTWLHGDGTWAGYQDLYDAVRKTAGANNIVLIAGLDWGYQLDFVNDAFCVQGENIIYCSHPYNDKGSSSSPVPFEKNFAGILGKYPIIFTEFGSNQEKDFPPQSTNYQGVYQRLMDYIGRHAIHYTGFEWFVDRLWAPSLIANWQGAPSAAGNYIKNDLQKNPPTPL